MSSVSGMGNEIFSLVYCLLYGWCASCFLARYLQGTFWEKRIFTGLFFGCYGVMILCLKDRGIPYILYAMGNHAMLVGLTVMIFRGEKEKKLLAAVILVVVTELTQNFSESFLWCMGLFVIRMAAEHSSIVLIEAGIGRIITLIICGTNLAALNLLAKPLQPIFIDKRKSWYFYLSVPLFCVVLVTDLANWAASNGIMVHDWGKYGLYENQFFSHGAMCIFTGLAMAAAGSFVFGMERMEREERAGEQYRSQVRYYQMMEMQYSQTERLRHDMKNHIIALTNLVQNRQWEKAGAYLRELAKAGGIEAGDEVTGSLVIDALLYHKRREAAEKGIDWQCDARLPADCPVKEIDLCIIVGNILDNALEACSRLQGENRREGGDGSFIRIDIGTRKKYLFLEVQNRTDLADGWESSQNRRVNPGEHGLGVGNIRAAVNAYHGAMHMEVKNRVFTIAILVPLYQGERLK